MSHLSHESAWALSRGELPDSEGAALRLHLASCPQCQGQQRQVDAAVALLARPQAPALHPASALRIRRALVAEAQRKPWWHAFTRPSAWIPLVAVTAALLVLVTRPGLTARLFHEEADRLEAGAEQRQAAQVVLASAAWLGDAPAQLRQVLQEGATVSTVATGALELAFADGSQAGLSHDTGLRLERLREHDVAVELTRGTVRFDAPHRPERRLTLRAGDVEVRDVGTVFSVTAEARTVVVAVTSGEVEVVRGAQVERLRAGQGARFGADGARSSFSVVDPDQHASLSAAARQDAAHAVELAQLEDELQPAPPPPPAAPPTPSPMPPRSAPKPAAPPAPAPPVEPPAAAPEWAGLPAEGSAKPSTVSPPPPPPPSDAQKPAEPLRTQGHGSTGVGADQVTLSAAEKRLRELAASAQAPFNGGLANPREVRVKEVHKLMEADVCLEAVRKATVWLAEAPSPDPAEPRWRRAMMIDQARCLTKLGRNDEAAAVRANLPP